MLDHASCAPSAGAGPGDRVHVLLRRLSTLGMHVAVTGGPPGALRGAPWWPLPGPGLLLLCAEGPSPVEVSLRWLEQLGVAGELVLVVGDVSRTPGRGRGTDAPPPAGGEALLALLEEQVHRAASLRVPGVHRDPRWSIVEEGIDAARHRVTESLFTLATGGVGFRGSVEEAPGHGQPLVVAAGVYTGASAADGLLPGPDVVDVHLAPPVQEDVRVLDLRTGVLHRTEVAPEVRPGGGSQPGPPLRSLRFASTTVPGLLAVRVEAAQERLEVPEVGGRAGWSEVGDADGGIGALTHQDTADDGGVRSVQRLVAVDASAHGPVSRRRARRRLSRATAAGFEAALAQHRSTWARRWERVGVTIPGDPETELGLRHALFQLWGLSGAGRELAVGARGLTGGGYSGHVFWDADVFVLPALVTVDPSAAAAMVRYRLDRLDAARARARADGRDGARFPWESGRHGHDVTPAEGCLGSERIAILTGALEEHITADVAWAVVHHASWTRPSGALTADESLLLRETATYWASRVSTAEDGSAHLLGVIGPDEYHERVDDNAFTNAMARWNLRTAAHLTRSSPDERARWLAVADALVDGFDPATGIYEQFRGYDDLRTMVASDVAPPPVAADVLAGRAVVAASQVIKQPDVLMMHHLLPDDVAAGSLVANLDHYAPRTAHGSSLSPAVMASLHARAGRPDTALELLRLSLRIDLEDLGDTTAAGVHLGACGGAWQAVLHGFLGARVSQDRRLHLDPVLPSGWSDLDIRFRCLSNDVRIRVEDARLSVDASGPLEVQVAQTSRYLATTSTSVVLTRGAAPWTT